MGFLSDLFDITPHITIAEKARDFCINSKLTHYEQNIIRNNKIDKEEFIRLRNIFNIKMFIGLFQDLDSKMPNTRFGITYTHFQQLYWDYYHGSGESVGWAMWDDSAEEFAQKVTGIKFTKLNPSLQKEFRELANRHYSCVINFFKENKKKLSETVA
jgi:hypothetical protein